FGRFARRSDYLLVPCVADQDDGVPLARVAARLRMDLRHERTGGIDRVERTLLTTLVDCGSDPVRREDDDRALRNFGFALDENRAAFLELANDVAVVDDLLADVEGRPVELERPLDRLERALESRAIAAG